MVGEPIAFANSRARETRRRKPANKLSPGDAFTLAGVGRGAKGQMVVDGVNPATNRKCQAVAPMRFEVRGNK